MSVTFPAVSNSSIPPASDTHRVDQMRAYWRKTFQPWAEYMADALEAFNRVGTYPGMIPASLEELHLTLQELLPHLPKLPVPNVLTWSSFRTGHVNIRTTAMDVLLGAYVVPMRQRCEHINFQLIDEGIFRYADAVSTLRKRQTDAQQLGEEYLAWGSRLAREALEKALWVLLGSYPTERPDAWTGIQVFFRLWESGYMFIGMDAARTPVLLYGEVPTR